MPTSGAKHPLAPFLAGDGVIVLDGALATELERRGADLLDPLWSARILLENPDLIRQVHYDYYAAGADVAITASYQATFPGLARRGLDPEAAADLMRLSVRLAMAARDQFWATADPWAGRHRPLVAASIGPYGAFLADGSEYRGDYGLSREDLRAFHRPRMAVLAASGADLLACETIPSLVEAEALVALLAEFPGTVAWLSFSCGDVRHLWDGNSLAAGVDLANTCDQVIATGINCTAPDLVEPLLASVRGRVRKPVVVYPNRGERWDAVGHCWIPGSGLTEFGEPARRWYAAGARIIGGCCRTTPEDIRAIARTLGRQV